MVIKFFKALIFEWRKNRAIKRAKKYADKYRRRQIVLVYKGKPEVFTVQGIKNLIARKKFKKGFSIDDAFKIAIYVAIPQPKNKEK